MSRHVRLVISLGLLTAFAPMSIDMYLPGFDAMQRDLRTRPEAVQASLVVFFLGLAIGQAVWGPVSDRFGRKRPLLAGIALYAVASVGCALAGSIEALVVARALQALGGCAGIVIARSMVRDLFDAVDAARVFSRLTLVLGAAPILAPLAGGWIVTHLGWRAIFGVLTAFALLCAALAWRLPESLPAARRTQAAAHPVRAALHTYAELLRDRRFIAYALAGGLGQAAMFAYIAGAPFVFMQGFGLSPQQFALLFGANALGLIAASQLNHALLARWSSAALLQRALRSLAGWGLAMLALAATGIGGMWGVALPLFIALASLGFSFPNATALALAHQGHRAGSAAALLGSLQFLLATASSTAVGLGGAHSALPMAAVFVAFALGAALVQRLAAREVTTESRTAP